jgi:hypothetical protein
MSVLPSTGATVYTCMQWVQDHTVVAYASARVLCGATSAQCALAVYSMIEGKVDEIQVCKGAIPISRSRSTLLRSSTARELYHYYRCHY